MPPAAVARGLCSLSGEAPEALFRGGGAPDFGISCSRLVHKCREVPALR